MTSPRTPNDQRKKAWPDNVQHLAFSLPKEDAISSFYRQVFTRLLKDDAVGILDRHEKRSGNRLKLMALLSGLKPPPPVKILPSHRTKTQLAGLQKKLTRLLKVSNLPFPIRFTAEDLLREVENCLVLWQDYLRGTEFVKKGRGAGRPRGVSRESLILAVVEKEFRQRFGRPCYADILALAKAVAPKTFAGSCTKEHIRQRIISVPGSLVGQVHRQAFAEKSR